MAETTNTETRSTHQFRLPDGMPRTLTMRETAAIMRCGVNGCYEAAKRGEIPTIRIGRRLVVPTLALMRLLDGGCGGACHGQAGATGASD